MKAIKICQSLFFTEEIHETQRFVPLGFRSFAPGKIYASNMSISGKRKTWKGRKRNWCFNSWTYCRFLLCAKANLRANINILPIQKESFNSKWIIVYVGFSVSFAAFSSYSVAKQLSKANIYSNDRNLRLADSTVGKNHRSRKFIFPGRIFFFLPLFRGFQAFNFGWKWETQEKFFFQFSFYSFSVEVKFI